MKRAGALALLIVLSSVAGVGLVDAATTGHISDVTVSPKNPVPGERFTIQTTIKNSEQSSGGFQVTDVYIRRPGSTDEISRVENPGNIPPGASIKVPLTASFENPGTRELRVHVVGRRSGGELVKLQYPAVVTVRQSGPQVSLSTGDVVVGAENTVKVTAVNGENSPARSVRVSLSGTDVQVEDDTRLLAKLNESRTFNFSVTPQSADAELDAELQYTTSTGNTRVVNDKVALDTEPLRESVEVDATTAGSGAQPAVAVDISNLGNAPLENPVIELSRNDTVLLRRPAKEVASDQTRTVKLNVTDIESGPLDVRVGYHMGDQASEATTTFQYSANPGRVALTSLDYSMQRGKLHITGSASNVGLEAVDSVTIRTVKTETVTPVRPNSEYFVGSIPSSDFATFDLTAQVTPGTETVPIKVTYLSNGTERTVRKNVDVSDLIRRPVENKQDSGSDGGSGGGLPSIPLLIGGVVAMLLVVGVSGYAYKQR
ncbi:hypothetical protein [Halogeometricum borinquense]|uniref:hypothetical protein n=1 Tax=Halogeometricum borinquense TaxID=60847 RepID=UPI0034285A13